MYQRPRPLSARAIAKPYRFLRLPAVVAAGELLDEVRAVVPEFVCSEWKWHVETRFCVLRGGRDTFYPGSGLVHGQGIDTAVLQRLPRVRAFLNEGLPGRATRAWLGLSPPGARIFLHTDNTPHWDEHHRVHVPLETHAGARLCCDGHFAHLAAGSAWLFNNSLPHGMINRGPQRLHLILDLPPSPALERWIERAEVVPGEPDPEEYAELGRDPLESLTSDDRENPDRMRRFLEQ